MYPRVPLGDILFSILSACVSVSNTHVGYTIRLGFECRLIIYVCLSLRLSVLLSVRLSVRLRLFNS